MFDRSDSGVSGAGKAAELPMWPDGYRSSFPADRQSDRGGEEVRRRDEEVLPNHEPDSTRSVGFATRPAVEVLRLDRVINPALDST